MTDPTYPTLIEDIVLLAQVNEDSLALSTRAAAQRVMAAHLHGGGLATVLLRQTAGALESRLVTWLRAETERLAAGG